MTVLILIVLAAAVIFAFGILIGQGLNGRTQIALDKSLAAARHELNDRLHALAVAAQLARDHAEEARNYSRKLSHLASPARANVMDL